MSIPAKDLESLRNNLERGSYRKIAKEHGCTPDWVSKVLNSSVLAGTHSHIVESAVQLIELKKQSVAALTDRIKASVK